MKELRCRNCGGRSARGIQLGSLGSAFCSEACAANFYEAKSSSKFERKRRRLVSSIEKARNTKVIVMVHRHEQCDGREFITIEDSEEILDQRTSRLIFYCTVLVG